MENFLTLIILALFAALFACYNFFKMKLNEKNKKLIDLEVKGAKDAANAEVGSKSLPDIVGDNNKRYSEDPSK
jgi:hypothetical protein